MEGVSGRVEAHAEITTRHLPIEYFKLNRISTTSHSSRICQPDGTRAAGWDRSTVIRIESFGVIHDAAYFDLQMARPCNHRHSIDATYDGVSVVAIDVVPGSVLDSLGDKTGALAARYPWSAHEALWFLLTNPVPVLDPVRVHTSASYGARGTFASITMVIEPWVSEHTVRAIYRDVQRRRFKTPSKCPHPTSFRLVSFVNAARERATKTMEWAELRRAWQTAKQPTRFGSPDAFGRAYLRTSRWLEKEIWLPAYKLFRRAAEPNPEDQPAGPKARGRGRGTRA
jgi:hypothetical protein